MNEKAWYFIPINPQPWTTPPFYPSRVNGKMIVKAGRNEANAVFAEAIRDELEKQKAAMLSGRFHKITFVFWRRLDKYKDSIGRTRTKNRADATNMQKLTEDALQGVLFANDRDNVSVSSYVAEQRADILPGILIMCESLDEYPDFEIPSPFSIHDRANILKAIIAREDEVQPESVNDWPPRP